jgi:hypothetical protein
MQRISSNKISTAFLNRVIRIWLPSIDKDLNFREFNDQILKGHLYNCIHDNDNQKSIFLEAIEPLVKKSDLYKMLEKSFVGIHGGEMLCLILTKFHSSMKCLIENAEIIINEGTKFTVRKALNTIRTFDHIFKKPENNFKKSNQLIALLLSIVRNYIYNVSRESDRLRLYKILGNIISSNENLVQYAKLMISDSTVTKRLNEEIQKMNIEPIMCEIEKTLSSLITVNINATLENHMISFKLFQNIYNFVIKILIKLNQQNDQPLIKYLENVGLNLNDASKTSDYDKAKEIFKVMCRFEQKINGVDKSILNQNFDLKDLVEKIENTMKELSKNLLKLAKSSSLYVIKERKDYIKRVTSTIHIFEEFLSNLIEFIPSNLRILKFSKSVLACLESFFSIELIFDVLNRLF